MKSAANDKAIDGIVDEMVHVVENSKDEIFHIGEEAIEEYKQLQTELVQIKKDVKEHILHGDEMAKEVQKARQRLSSISKQFDRYTELDIKEVYEETHKKQTELAMMREREANLRKRRDDIERRLKSLDQTIVRTESLTSKTAVILKYLNNEFKMVNEMIEDAKEKQEFSIKIIEAQERERKKISHDIHDGPTQAMANILLRSEMLERFISEDDVEKAGNELKYIRGLIRQSLIEVRRMIYDLRPMALDDLGLDPTIKKYVSTVTDYSGVQIDYISNIKDIRLKHNYEIVIFRIIQESLQNVMKHAKATHVSVQMELANQSVHIRIKDNGRGFNPDNKKSQSFGLIGMQERTDMLDGNISVNSALGKGTTIYVTIPIKE